MNTGGRNQLVVKGTEQDQTSATIYHHLLAESHLTLYVVCTKGDLMSVTGLLGRSTR